MDIQESSPKLEEKPSHRVAVIRVALEVVESLLPEGTKVLAVSPNEFHNTVDVTVTHPSFDEIENGTFPPLKQLTIYRKNVIDRVEYAS